jgi:tetratricopeptide (TPR) repeat protein
MIKQIGLALILTWLHTNLALAAPSKRIPEDKSTPNVSSPAPTAIDLYNQGTTLLKQKQFKQAQTLFEQALKADETLAEAHNNLAYALRQQGSDFFEKALIHYNRAIELDPKLMEAYEYRGTLYVLQGKLALAQQDLEILKQNNSPLATELEYVIKNGKEPEDTEANPGVVDPIKK